MQIIKILANDNGSHDEQTLHGQLPNGWAVIRDKDKCENFPFGSFEVEMIDGVPYMKEGSWIPGEMPEPEPVEPEPTAQDDTDAMLVDHELRLTMLELGLMEEV